MTILIRSISALAACLCATGCWANASALFVRYECSAGEKPGSPRYELFVLGSEYRVEKSSAALPRPKMQRVAYGSLTRDEQNALARLTPALAAARVVQPQGAHLAGFCSWKVDVRGTGASDAFYNVAKLGPEFTAFMQWIRALKAKDPEGNQILPIIPGEEAPWYP